MFPSNSYWIDDNTPCITYGLRGLVQASLEVVQIIHGMISCLHWLAIRRLQVTPLTCIPEWKEVPGMSLWWTCTLLPNTACLPLLTSATSQDQTSCRLERSRLENRHTLVLWVPIIYHFSRLGPNDQQSDDAVRPETTGETSTYANIAKLTGTQPSKISSRWREPSLTVHNVMVSGSNSPCYALRNC